MKRFASSPKNPETSNNNRETDCNPTYSLTFIQGYFPLRLTNELKYPESFDCVYPERHIGEPKGSGQASRRAKLPRPECSEAKSEGSGDRLCISGYLLYKIRFAFYYS